MFAAMSSQPRTGCSLVFGRNDGADAGFASPHVGRESVTEEGVVRELLQNALDASAGGARADFRLQQMPVADIPCIGQYRETFAAARAHRFDKVDSPAERQAVDRIERCLRAGAADVLVCADEGGGIGVEELRALYSTGDTTKRSGRGSVGLGHLGAFALSDLRYVLYAGRRRDGAETFGGHAVLATSTDADGLQRDAHGYIRGEHEPLAAPASQATGATCLADAAHRWLPEKTEAGSAVAVVGYAAPDKGPLEARIFAAAAKSFFVAVHRGDLQVRYSDAEQRLVLGPQQLRGVLEGISGQQRRRRGQGVPGSAAHLAYETVVSGERIALDGSLAGVTVWFRDLPAGRDPLVCVTREGMWITAAAQHLTRGDFAGYAPFCAVIDASPADRSIQWPVCALIREAEGTTHSQIRPKEITDPARAKLLDEALRAISEKLRSMASPAAGQMHEPPQLRMFRGEMLSPVPLPRQGHDQPDAPADITAALTAGADSAGDEPDNGPAFGPDTEPAPGGDAAGVAPSSRKIAARGNTAGIRTASRRIKKHEWAVAWQAERFHAGAARVTAVLPSGADETTDRQLGDTLVKIKALRHNHHRFRPSAASDGLEVILEAPPLQGDATVEIAAGVADADAPTLKIRVTHAAAKSPIAAKGAPP